MIAMHDAAFLQIRLGTYGHGFIVAAQGGAEPDADLCAEHDFANDAGRLGHIGRVINLGSMFTQLVNGHLDFSLKCRKSATASILPT